MIKKDLLSEDLKRFNSIIGYSVEGKRKLNEAPEDEQGGGEFDFGGEGEDTQNPEGENQGGNDEFDFGDEGSPEDEQGGED
jgi:hypothetical protein